MSNYINFIQDFPSRCGIILTELNQLAKKNNLEVTHMLSVASVAITIPFERLRSIGGNNPKHPSNDRNHYFAASSKFDKICRSEFIGSKLWDNTFNEWKNGVIDQNKLNDQPESWVSDAKDLPSPYKVKWLLKHIRNAISHGNIYYCSLDNKNISELIFLDRIYDGDKFTGMYRYLILSVDSFYIFLIMWIDFLEKEIKLEEVELN